MEGPAVASAHDYVKPKAISIKNHPELNERWVQDRLASDPSILGLGDDLVRFGKEVTLPGGGRLDLLFVNSDEEEPKSYEVEVQLGATDPSHIIRTIEYWELEQRRYPEREHVAVLVAEDITSRFLNVISLLNKTVPIIAIQMQAIQVGVHLTLVFTTVVDLYSRPDEADEASATADLPYWEKKAHAALPIVNKVFGFVQTSAPGFDLKYNLNYIRINKGGKSFMSITPTKTRSKIKIRMAKTTESEVLKAHLENEGLDVSYEESAKGGPKYRVVVDNDKFEAHASSIEKLISLGLKGIE